MAIAKCKSYGANVLPTMARMFDQLGGIGALVRGKTVAVKLNLTGSTYWLGYLPAERAHYTHPNVVGAGRPFIGTAGVEEYMRARIGNRNICSARRRT